MAPYGAIVPVLPWWYGTCVIGGVTYYVVDDTWYRRTSRGYRVVRRPTTVVVERRVVATPPPVVEAPPVVESAEYVESYVDLDGAPDGTWHTVWLDTDEGTRLPIDLLRVDGLWRGPRDEYYDRLPTNEQLSALYAPIDDEDIDETERATRREVVWIENFNQSRTRVVLHQSLSGRWVGQHGEFYDEFPSEEQLRQLYGLSPD